MFKYSVRDNVSAGSGELEVKDVDLEDSGVYVCHQLNSSVNNAMFQLSVVDGKHYLGLVYLLLVVTFHLVLEVFARQLLLSEIVSPLTSVPAKLSQHSAVILKAHIFHSALPTAYSDPSQRL